MTHKNTYQAKHHKFSGYNNTDSATPVGDAKQHPPKPGLGKMHVPADLRALGITSMRDFVTG